MKEPWFVGFLFACLFAIIRGIVYMMISSKNKDVIFRQSKNYKLINPLKDNTD